jgi:hypothetical protein
MGDFRHNWYIQESDPDSSIPVVKIVSIIANVGFKARGLPCAALGLVEKHTKNEGI